MAKKIKCYGFLFIILAALGCAEEKEAEEKIVFRDRQDADAEQPQNQRDVQNALDTCNSQGIRNAVNAGADIDQRNDFGQTALTASISNCPADVTLTILDLGADTNIANENGQLPIDMLIARSDFQLAQKLINDYNANPQLLDKAFQKYLDEYQLETETVLEVPFTYDFGKWNKSIDYASYRKQLIDRRELCINTPSDRKAKLNFLLNNGLVVAPIQDLTTPRLHAVSMAMRAGEGNGDFCTAVLLMESDRFEIDSPTATPNLAPTLFWEAIELQSVEYVILFESYGADPQMTDGSNDLPIIIAAQKENRDLVRLLFAIGDFKGSSIGSEDKKRACKVTEDKCIKKIMACGLRGTWLIGDIVNWVGGVVDEDGSCKE